MRNLMSILILISALVLSVAVTAQDDTNSALFCGTLSAEDCAIFTSGNAPTSALVNGNGAVNVTVFGEVYSVGLDIDGSYIANPEIIPLFDQMSTMDPAEAYQMLYRDADSFVKLITDLFQVGDANLAITLDLPEIVTEGFIPSPLTVDLWMVEGVGYVDLTAFSFADPTLSGVYGIDFVDFYNDVFNFLLTDPDVQQMFDDALGNLADTQADTFDQAAAMNAYTTITRQPDEIIDGTRVAVFETQIDYGALFASDIMREAMQAQLDLQRSMMGDDLSDADMAMMEGMFDGIIDAYAIAFDGSAYSLIQKIGLEDSYLYSSDVLFTMDVDVEAVTTVISAMDMGAMSAADLDLPPRIQFDLLMGVEQSAFDTVTDISLPDSARIVPLEQLGIDFGSTDL